MTSLTAYLISGTIPPRPRGKVRTVTMESRSKANRSEGQMANAARNEKTRLANIEAIYNAIADGNDGIKSIKKATGLSQCTVVKGLNELEDWPGGKRILRTKGKFGVHIFSIVETKP